MALLGSVLPRNLADCICHLLNKGFENLAGCPSVLGSFVWLMCEKEFYLEAEGSLFLHKYSEFIKKKPKNYTHTFSRLNT